MKIEVSGLVELVKVLTSAVLIKLVLDNKITKLFRAAGEFTFSDKGY